MTPKTFNILAPHPITHSEAIYQLIGTQWSSSEQRCRLGRISQSHLDWQVSRIGLLGDELISFWGVYDLQMRIGNSQVRTAGINLPVTRSAYRGRGFMPKTVASSLQAMLKMGYDLSVINKTHAYFTRFGYVVGWPQTHFYINTEDLPTELPSVTFESVDMQDWIARAELFDIYNEQNRGLTGTSVRPTYHRGKIPSLDGNYGYLLLDPNSNIVGYLYDALPLEQDVFYTHTDSAGNTIERLKVLGLLARQHHLKGVYFHRLHYLSELSVQLRKLNCRMEVEYRSQSGYLIRIINLQSTLQKMTDELSNRLEQSAMLDWSGELLVKVDQEAVTLTINRGQIQVNAPLESPHRIEGGQAISQLLIGAGDPLEIVEKGNIHLFGEAKYLIKALFPNQYPQMPNEDL